MTADRSEFPNLHVLDHPLIQHKLSLMRDKRTPSTEFRRLAPRVSLLVVAEATRDLPTAQAQIETPLETTTARLLSRRVVAVPVLRAGLTAVQRRPNPFRPGFGNDSRDGSFADDAGVPPRTRARRCAAPSLEERSLS